MEHGDDEGAGPVVLWSTDVTGLGARSLLFLLLLLQPARRTL